MLEKYDNNSNSSNYDFMDKMRESYDPRTGRTLTAKNNAKIQGNLAKHNYFWPLVYIISDIIPDILSFIFVIVIIVILFFLHLLFGE